MDGNNFKITEYKQDNDRKPSAGRYGTMQKRKGKFYLLEQTDSIEEAMQTAIDGHNCYAVDLATMEAII